MLHVILNNPTAWFKYSYAKICLGRRVLNILKKQYAVVVVQLVEWSLPTPEVCGSNHAMGKLLCRAFVIYQLIEKTKRERGRKWPIWKLTDLHFSVVARASFTWPKFRCFVFFQTLFWDLLPGRRQQNSIELLVAGQGSSVAAVVLTEHARKIH